MASGDTLLVWTGQANEPPAANAMTMDTRNSHPVYDADAAATERRVVSGVMPQHYDGGGIDVLFHHTMSVDNNALHGVRTDIALEDDSALDLDADDFAAAQSVTTAPNATLGIETVGTIPFTDGAQMDNVGKGDRFRLYIERDHDHGDDDATGDTEYAHIEMREA